MNRYENGKIYKIVDVGYNKCYIGSTCESLSQRMARHRAKYARYLKGHKIDTSTSYLFSEFGVENCKIELIENYPCSGIEELHKREGFYIQSIECINRCVAGRNYKEWVEQNADRVKEIKDKYYQNNKDLCKERVKQHRTNNYEHSKQIVREYREKNREILNQKSRERYETNKPERSKKILCNFCQAYIRNDIMKRHQRTKKCKSCQENN